MTLTLVELAKHGQSAWVDHLSRDFVQTGELAELVAAGVSGVTSNPTIFQRAIAEGDAYDAQMTELLRTYDDPKDVFHELARVDVQAACDLLAGFGVAGTDGWVSLEVDPRLADDTDATLDEAIRLHRTINRPNMFVKIPGTPAGLPAIEESIARGIPVNVTLLFSLRRHLDAAQAYVRGLQRLRFNGGDLSKVASVASFFVSRVDTEADRRLDAIGGHDDLKGTLGIANAKQAYQTYKVVFSGPEWTELARAGASPQRCLWASTSTKNPAYRDVRYVEELIGPDTVDTMPRETIAAFRDHGRVEDTLEQGVDEAEHTFQRFAAAGVDYDDIVATLELEGVTKFAASYAELLRQISKKHAVLPAR